MIRTLIAASALVLATTTLAAAAPKLLDQHSYWGAFTYKDAKRGKLCYVLAVPQAKAPEDRNHGDVYFVVSAKKGSYEPQVEVGYPLKPDADVSVQVSGRSFKVKTFPMFVNANNAWLKDTKNSAALVEAMRKGDEMTVKGVSKKGTQTSYVYSLKGVSAALNTAAKCS